MDVDYQCEKCNIWSTAYSVPDRSPTPQLVIGTCPNCNHRNLIRSQTIIKWLEDRDLEVINTSHSKPFIQDIKNLSDIIFEFTLRYSNQHDLTSYQVGYFESALVFLQQWAMDNGFDPKANQVYNVTVTYNHTENNCNYVGINQPIGMFGTLESAEKGITKRMSWLGSNFLKRGNFTITKI